MKIGIKIAFIITAAAILLTTNSCKSTKDVALKSSQERAAIAEVEDILGMQPQFTTMTTKCTISAGNLKSKAQIKMINGEYIQISLQPLLGIEMVKIMLTPDSLYVIDKIGSQAAVEPISTIKNKISREVGISEIQKIFMGRPFIIGAESEKIAIQKQKKQIKLINQITQAISTIFYINDGGYIDKMELINNTTPIAEGYYTNYTTDENGYSFPSAINLKTSVIRGTMSQIAITNLSPMWGKAVSIDTKISSKYKRVSLNSLIDNYIQ